MKLLFYDSEIPILLKNTGNPIGGACVRQYAIARGLVDNDHQVGILTWKGAKKYIGHDDFAFDLVESFPRDKGIKVLRALYIWMPKLYKAISKYQPDYLFQKGPSANTAMLGIIAKWLGIPFVYMVTNNWDGDDRLSQVKGPGVRFLFSRGLKMTTAIICQNEYQEQTFKKKFPDKKTILMHNPLFVEGGMKPAKPLSERKYFAWIGNFKTVKNMPGAYEIAKSMPEFDFKIAGARVVPKSYDPGTKDAYEKLKKLPNVEIVGHVKRAEVLPLLANAYALFSTSHMEGFSNVFLEALAAGTPIVTRDIIDPDGLLARNELGTIVKTCEEMPKAMLALIDENIYNNMAARCQQYVSDNHNPKTITHQLLSELVG